MFLAHWHALQGPSRRGEHDYYMPLFVLPNASAISGIFFIIYFYKQHYTRAAVRSFPSLCLYRYMSTTQQIKKESCSVFSDKKFVSFV